METFFNVLPLRVEGLFLSDDKMVSSPLADFSKLPWNDGTKDINFDNPFVGDGIIHQPFGGQNLLLKAGVHLHFIIPHFLGQKIPKNSGLPDAGNIPAAPNRWLVTKNTTQWYIESDYIHDVAYNPFDPGRQDRMTCIIPFNSGQPYRYMGRTTLLSETRLNGDTFKALNNNKPLTVVGYGDINFSSFYPNCMGVFGFHDSSETTPASSLNYSILGWHADAEDDVLNNAIAAILQKDVNTTVEEINSQLKNLFKLEINANDTSITASSVPRTIFYGEIVVDNIPSKYNGSSLQIAIGNTGTEALSALLGKQLSITNNNVGLKAIVEEQLESILLFSKLDHLLVDTGPKFLEARHDKGFKSSHSGYIWRIVSQSDSHTSSPDGNASVLPDVPPDLAGLLHQLNLAQSSYDQNNQEVDSLREQLYLDWYKYMHAAYPPLEGRGQYPDPDHIRYFIETYSFAELNNLIILTGNVEYNNIPNGVQPTATSTLPTDLANQLCNAWNAVNNLLTSENLIRVKNNQPQLSLSMIGGPRYWEPTAPVIMISGLPGENTEVVSPESDYQIVNLYSSGQTLDLNSISTQNAGDILRQCSGTSSYKLSGQSWNPFILDWEVDLTDTNFLDTNGSFESDAIQNNFDLNQFGPDFTTNKYQTGNLSVFSGSVIMSSHSKDALLFSLKNFVVNLFRKNGITFKIFGSDFTLTPPRKSVPEILKDNKITFNNNQTLEQFLSASSWGDAFAMLNPTANTAITGTVNYKSNPLCYAWQYHNSLNQFLSSGEWSQAFAMLALPSSIATITSNPDFSSDPLYTVWSAYQKLLSNNVLSQTLNGFNQASIMRRKTAQLPIEEPLGFEDAQKFTENVKSLVLNNRDTSPISAFDFNPIRSGQLKLNRLRLTDNFGIPFDLNVNDSTPVAAETLLDRAGNIFLRPRLAQPARLNFRWLSATSVSDSENSYEDITNTAETNDHPDTSPVCGWLMANYIDNTIAVYAADGTALGYIDQNAEWNVLPWVNVANNVIANISNPYLLNTVLWIMNTFQSSTNAIKINDFLTATQAALNNIAPANANLYSSKAILMGRPMVVVRSRVSFQIKGLPVLEQGWPALLNDLNNCDTKQPYTYSSRYKKEWTSVQLPVRLGEHHQLNDGLIGYWTEDSQGSLSTKFIAPETTSNDVTGTTIDTFTGGNFQTQWLSLNDAPMNSTMLVDPRGIVHATTGILPVKSISIPPQYYLSALKKISMWFHASPLLQPVAESGKNLVADLPVVEGYTWQWWDVFNGSLTIKGESSASDVHSSTQMIEGWLSLIPKNSK